MINLEWYNKELQQLCKYRENIITQLHIAQHHENENKKYFLGKRSFIRDRNLTFSRLISLISGAMNKSLQRELDDFYQKVINNDFQVRGIIKGAFIQA